MGLEHVKHEIIGHAEHEAQKLMSSAKQQAKKDMDAAHAVIDAFEAEIQEQLAKEIEQLERKYAAGMKLLSKKILLQKRKEILNTLFEDLRSTLSHLEKAEKSRILHALFTKAKKQCTAGTVYCAKQDMAIVRSFASSVKEQQMIGGIIVESKDCNYLIDYSFDSMVHQLYEKQLQEINKLLFGE